MKESYKHNLYRKKGTRAICIENQEHCTQVFRKVDNEWDFDERNRGHVICSSGACTKTKNQFLPNVDCVEQKYEHRPADVVENGEEEFYWDLTIQTDMTVTHNGPNIILVEKAIRKWSIIDIAFPSDFNIVRTEDWKVEKYQDLAFEVKRIHSTSCDRRSRNSTKATHQVN